MQDREQNSQDERLDLDPAAGGVRLGRRCEAGSRLGRFSSEGKFCFLVVSLSQALKLQTWPSDVRAAGAPGSPGELGLEGPRRREAHSSGTVLPPQQACRNPVTSVPSWESHTRQERRVRECSVHFSQELSKTVSVCLFPTREPSSSPPKGIFPKVPLNSPTPSPQPNCQDGTTYHDKEKRKIGSVVQAYHSLLHVPSRARSIVLLALPVQCLPRPRETVARLPNCDRRASAPPEGAVISLRLHDRGA